MPLRVRIHSSVVSMIRASFSFETTFFGMPIPLPVMTLFMDAKAYTARRLLLPDVIGGSHETNHDIGDRAPRVCMHAETAGRDVSRDEQHLGSREEGAGRRREARGQDQQAAEGPG